MAVRRERLRLNDSRGEPPSCNL